MRDSLSNQEATETGLGSVLIVDDEPVVRRALRRLLTTAGHSVVEAGTQAEARLQLAKGQVDLVVLDLNLPDGTGLDILSHIRASDGTAGVVVLTGSSSSDDVDEALRRGASAYLNKSSDPSVLKAQITFALAHARSNQQERTSLKHLQACLGEAISILDEIPETLAVHLSRAWDLRHVETGAHVRRISEYTKLLSCQLGLPIAQATSLGRVAMLHDIGKIAIPDAILGKPGRLTDEEFTVMKLHTLIGEDLLRGYHHPFMDLAAMVARSHHERWDGSGYPDGLVGEACPKEARIVALVDVYDALGEARCYKPAWPREQINEYLVAGRGTLFEAGLVDALMAIAPQLESVRDEHPDPVPTRV